MNSDELRTTLSALDYLLPKIDALDPVADRAKLCGTHVCLRLLRDELRRLLRNIDRRKGNQHERSDFAMLLRSRITALGQSLRRVECLEAAGEQHERR